MKKTFALILSALALAACGASVSAQLPTTEEALTIFDGIVAAEGAGVDVQKVDGVLPADTVPRFVFAQDAEWCAREDDEETCESAFKDALWVYGMALEMSDGSALCDGMNRKECMEEGKSSGHFPGAVIVTTQKADEAAAATALRAQLKDEDRGRRKRVARHQQSKTRKRDGGDSPPP